MGLRWFIYNFVFHIFFRLALLSWIAVSGLLLGACNEVRFNLADLPATPLEPCDFWGIKLAEGKAVSGFPNLVSDYCALERQVLTCTKAGLVPAAGALLPYCVQEKCVGSNGKYIQFISDPAKWGDPRVSTDRELFFDKTKNIENKPECKRIPAQNVSWKGAGQLVGDIPCLCEAPLSCPLPKVMVLSGVDFDCDYCKSPEGYDETNGGKCSVCSTLSPPRVLKNYRCELALPACTLTANPTSILSGGFSTLTADCGSGASYTWAGGSCAGTTGSACTVNPTETTGYTVQGTNTAGDGNVASATVKVTAVVQKPTCTLKANPTSIRSGGSSVLTAACDTGVNAPASYTWTGGNCVGSGSTCTVNPTDTTGYTVQGTNAAGDGNVASATVTVTAVVQKPTCTLSADPKSITSGDSSQLTADCDSGVNKPTSYIWTGGACEGVSGATCKVTPTSTTDYSVKGTNTAGAGNVASATVTVTKPQAPTCILTASPASITAGGRATLMANCTPSVVGTTYEWTGGTCAGTTSFDCLVTPTETTTYTITATNSGGSGQAARAIVTVVPQKPICTLSANPTKIGIGNSSILTADCGNGASRATSYIWSDSSCSSTSATCTVKPTSTTIYTVTGTNSGGSSEVVSQRVEVTCPALNPWPTSTTESLDCKKVDASLPDGFTYIKTCGSYCDGTEWKWTCGDDRNSKCPPSYCIKLSRNNTYYWVFGWGFGSGIPGNDGNSPYNQPPTIKGWNTCYPK